MSTLHVLASVSSLSSSGTAPKAVTEWAPVQIGGGPGVGGGKGGAGGGVGTGPGGGEGGGDGRCPWMIQFVQRLFLTWLDADPPPAREKEFVPIDTPSHPESAISVEFSLAPSKSKRLDVIDAFVTNGYEPKPPASSMPVCPLHKGSQLLLCCSVLFSIRMSLLKPTATSDSD